VSRSARSLAPWHDADRRGPKQTHHAAPLLRPILPASATCVRRDGNVAENGRRTTARLLVRPTCALVGDGRTYLVLSRVSWTPTACRLVTERKREMEGHQRNTAPRRRRVRPNRSNPPRQGLVHVTRRPLLAPSFVWPEGHSRYSRTVRGVRAQGVGGTAVHWYW
jgi:hypothetical protein